jgi:hypothetical protein
MATSASSPEMSLSAGEIAHEHGALLHSPALRFNASCSGSLAGVMHDKRANHAIFFTTAWFISATTAAASRSTTESGSSKAAELKHMLRLHLGLDVLVPSARRRRRRSDVDAGPAA